MVQFLPAGVLRSAWFRSVCVAGALLALYHAAAHAEVRTISITNIHTKETVTITFKKDGRYIDDGLKQFNHIMRDWRRNEPTKMDPALLDLMWEMHRELGSKKPVQLISGYRSPATNSALRAKGGGQARFSRHMVGQAADIQFPDVPLKQLRNSALIRERGGVGYYPGSGIPFIHIDTGNVRHWPRLPRQELAVLFPSGRSKHVPSDGRPITVADYRVALASLKERGGELPWALDKKRQQPQTVLASLGPTTLPGLGGLGGARKQQAVADPDATVPAGLMTRPHSLAALPAQRGTSPLPLPATGFSTEEVRLSEEGEEHEDEMLFEPLPIIELLTDQPLAQIEIQEEPRPPFSKVHLMLSAPNTLASLEFENGLQIESMYAVRRFEGPAISLVRNTVWARGLTGNNAPVASAKLISNR